MLETEEIHEEHGVAWPLISVIGIEEDVHLLRFSSSPEQLRSPLFEFLLTVLPVEALAGLACETVPGLGISTVETNDREAGIGHSVDRWNTADSDLWLVDHRVAQARLPEQFQSLVGMALI